MYDDNYKTNKQDYIFNNGDLCSRRFFYKIHGSCTQSFKYRLVDELRRLPNRIHIVAVLSRN